MEWGPFVNHFPCCVECPSLSRVFCRVLQKVGKEFSYSVGVDVRRREHSPAIPCAVVKCGYSAALMVLAIGTSVRAVQLAALCALISEVTPKPNQTGLTLTFHLLQG